MRELLVSWRGICLAILLASGCSDTATNVSEAGESLDVEDSSAETIDGEEIDGEESECRQDEDCPSNDPCVLQSLCLEGACVQTLADTGELCEEGCLVGACDSLGQCADLTLRTCDESDGNLCTVPGCDAKTGACTEEALPDGDEPHASTDCFAGAICMNGELDTSEAEPSELALQCETLTEGLDELACIDQFVCVGGDIGCQSIPRPDGAPCWIDGEEPSGATCQGHGCFAGECAIDNALSVSCGEANLPEECDASCAACTALTCQWIPDPAFPELGSRIAHCSPQGIPGEPCNGDPCSLEQTCAVGAPTTGPAGKETLGFCTGGVDKTKEQCAEEISLPAIDCILAGITCDGEQGCHFQKNVADQWCLASASQCVNTADTYCAHLDAGELWDPATGCHVATLDINCDDAKECTLDTCTNGAAGPECLHQPIEGAACDDGDVCTLPGICAGETCSGEPKCTNANENPCDDIQCAPTTGECVPAPVPGTTCDDFEVCTTATTCQETGLCGGGQEVDCSDGNDCTDDSCAFGLGCSLLPGAGPCSDENACTTADVCVGTTCVGQYSCNDDNLCTADACDPAEGCSNTPVPDEAQLTCVAGDTQWKCVGGECLCTPKCEQFSCGDDGCGGTCTCIKDTECVAELCVSTQGGGGTSGDWLVSANPSSQTLAGLFPATFVPTVYTLVIEENVLTGSTSAVGITVDYTGTVNGSDFIMTGSYSNSSLGLTESHVETWNCTFTSPTEFTGTMTDVITLLGSPFGNLTWNITGILQ